MIVNPIGLQVGDSATMAKLQLTTTFEITYNMDGEPSDGSPFTPTLKNFDLELDHVTHQHLQLSQQFPANSPSGIYSPYKGLEQQEHLSQNMDHANSQQYFLDQAQQHAEPPVGLLFPVLDQTQPAGNWSMPGAFNTGDAMDLDQLPPFTVALDMYFDANTPTVYDDNSNFMSAQNLAVPESQTNYNAVSPSMIDGKLRDATYNFQMGPACDQVVEPVEIPYTFSLEFQGIPGSDIHSFASKNDNNAPLAFVGNPDDERKHPLWNHPSVLVTGADLLPLTTTTLLTPSVLSIHLTQPSFFSAQQFIRTSIDQPPSLVHRQSIDVYHRGRLLIDSLNSGVNPPQRNPRSLLSYFPFMGDRDRKSPGSISDWPQASQAQQSQQLRHLIRSIFKTSSEPQQPDEEDTTFDAGFPDELFDEDALTEMDGTPLKKAKRSRRGFLNRFKNRVPEPDAKADHRVEAEASKGEFAPGDLVKQETHSSVPSRESASVQNLVQNSMQGLDPNSLQHINLANLAHMDAAEPDYGALFHGVGKRRNLVGMKNKKVAVKPEPRDGEVLVKLEPGDGEVARDSLAHFQRTSQDYHSGDSKLAQSLQLSQTSLASADGFAQDGSLSTFASASKRILGSRLLKRKASARVAEPQMDVVEIDLKLLDLPPNTEILSEINPKNRTRGRKEDKEADMVDQLKIYVCGYCSRRFKRQEHLKRHFRSLHTSEKPYECTICLKKFSRTDNLNQHLKVHKQEEEEAARGM